MKSRITEQVLLTGNLGKGLLSIPGVGGGENLRPLFCDAADNQLAVEFTQAPDTGTNSGQITLYIVLPGHALVHQLADIRLRVHLVNTGQAVDGAAKVKLSLIFASIAEQAVFTGGCLGHQELDLSRYHIHFDQNATCRAAVFFASVKCTVVEDIQHCRHRLRVEMLAQSRIHQGECISHGIVAGRDIHVIPVGNGRPGIALPPVALSLVCRRHDSVAYVVHDAVHRFHRGFLMGNFCMLICTGCICVGCCRNTHRNGTADCQNKQQTQYRLPRFHWHKNPSKLIISCKLDLPGIPSILLVQAKINSEFPPKKIKLSHSVPLSLPVQRRGLDLPKLVKFFTLHVPQHVL
ncbi:unknown [Firmicutes bacterium CAG:137]|nr:unknown [Firmicutes bacterium CAG:137]